MPAAFPWTKARPAGAAADGVLMAIAETDPEGQARTRFARGERRRGMIEK
jgi:hypothetical protein